MWLTWVGPLDRTSSSTIYITINIITMKSNITMYNKQSKHSYFNFINVMRGAIFRLELVAKRGPNAHSEIFRSCIWVDIKYCKVNIVCAVQNILFNFQQSRFLMFHSYIMPLVRCWPDILNHIPHSFQSRVNTYNKKRNHWIGCLWSFQVMSLVSSAFASA